MRAILKGWGSTAAQPHPGLVDEGGGLERMAGRFIGHLPRRQTAEFFVKDREKFGGGFWITVCDPFQNMRELGQDFRIGKRRRVTTSNALTLQPRVRGQVSKFAATSPGIKVEATWANYSNLAGQFTCTPP